MPYLLSWVVPYGDNLFKVCIMACFLVNVVSFTDIYIIKLTRIEIFSYLLKLVSHISSFLSYIKLV